MKRPLAAAAATLAVGLGLGADAAQAPRPERAGAERAFRRAVTHELRRLHLLNRRLRRAVAVGVPYELRAMSLVIACESGHQPRAVSPGGTYRGLAQWDMQTWRSVGGRGDPVDASVAQQWARALLLYDARGWGPWPQCGRGL